MWNRDTVEEETRPPAHNTLHNAYVLCLMRYTIKHVKALLQPCLLNTGTSDDLLSTKQQVNPRPNTRTMRQNCESFYVSLAIRLKSFPSSSINANRNKDSERAAIYTSVRQADLLFLTHYAGLLHYCAFRFSDPIGQEMQYSIQSKSWVYYNALILISCLFYGNRSHMDLCWKL